MKNRTNTNLVICSSLTLALALAIWSPVPVQSAEPAAGKMMMDGKMMERCQEMKAQKQKMMADMKAQDAELTEQVAKMNSAPADKKMSLMAAVITHMVEQRIAMDARMAKMQDEMMQHMMQHMQMGKDSMSQCPMMKGMKGMDDKSAAAGKMMMDGKMMERCQAMKEQKQKMMADMKAQDAELTEQVAKMNSAPVDKKTSLMAAVITRMVEQQAAMDARKAKMQEEMMQHMMQHMQMGKESMSQCPMMKGMKDMDNK
jgi:hypothetical protein